jgi:hypothetical protein
MTKSIVKIPAPKHQVGDIVLAPRWGILGRRFVIAQVENLYFVVPGFEEFHTDGYHMGWRYELSRGRMKWKELFEARIKPLSSLKAAEAKTAASIRRK